MGMTPTKVRGWLWMEGTADLEGYQQANGSKRSCDNSGGQQHFLIG